MDRLQNKTIKNENKGDFFKKLDDLIRENEIVIDRPKGSAHPRFSDLIYPIDYGYINGTKSQDGQGIDVFRGDDPSLGVIGIVCTLDRLKKDSEIKVLYNCTEDNISTILTTLNHGPMSGILVRRDQDFLKI